MIHCLVNDDCECIRDDELDTVNKVRHDYIRHAYDSKFQRHHGHGHSHQQQQQHQHSHHHDSKRKRHRQGSEIFTAISPELLKAAIVKHGEIHRPHRPWKLDKKNLQELYKAQAKLPPSLEVAHGSSRSDEQLIKPMYHSPYARPERVKATRSKSGVFSTRDPRAALHNKLERSLREDHGGSAQHGGYHEKSGLPSSRGHSGLNAAKNRSAEGTDDLEYGIQFRNKGGKYPHLGAGGDIDGEFGSLLDRSTANSMNLVDRTVDDQPFFITDTYVEDRIPEDSDEYGGESVDMTPSTAGIGSAGGTSDAQVNALKSRRGSRRSSKQGESADKDRASSSRKTTITTLHLNDPLHEEVTVHTSDPVLVSINAPPPFPAHLIDPSTNYSSNLTPLQHDARLKSIIAESKGAHIHDKRTSVGPSPAVIVPVLPTEQQVNAAPAMTVKEMEDSVKKNSLLPSIDIKQVDKHEDKIPKGKIKVEQKDDLEKPVDKVVLERKFKDVLEEILAPNGKKWAELCRLEFPDNVMWKTDGNLASLIVTYVECCVTQGKKLSLKAFYLRRLPPLVWLRHYLRSLNISFNRLEEMPSSIFYLRNLTILKARNNPMVVIDDQISKLKSLRYLVLSFCMFTEIPSSLFALSGLEILDVSYNLLRHMPREIMKMRSLRVVNISGNLIYELPACMIRLPRLSSILAADCYVNLTSGRRAINTVWRLTSLKDLAADVAAKRMMEEGTDPRDIRKTLYMPEPIAAILRSGHHCEWCGNPRYGIGHDLIKAEAVKKLRYSAFMLRFQVCARCSRNPYHVFTTEELEKHIALGQAELDKAEAVDRARREKEAQSELEKLRKEEEFRKSKKSR